MNKRKKQQNPPRLDGLGRPKRRDLRDKQPAITLGQNGSSNVRAQFDNRSRKPHSQMRQEHKLRDAHPLDVASMSDDLRSMGDPEPAAGRRSKRKGGKTSKFKAFFKKRKALKISGFVVLAVIGFIGYQLFSTVQASIIDRGKSALGLSGNIEPGQLKGEGDGRVNILLIGVGGENHPGGNLNDVTMVVSIDPANEDVAMLSIPRDLYMAIPGQYSSRINAAYALGEDDPTTTGHDLVEATVEDLLDIDIHYFAKIDFDGFVDGINEVGGITVDVPEAIYDPFIQSKYGNGRYGFSVNTGEQYMDGETALQYARSRKTTSDFDRAARQQIILQAVKDKALSLGTLTNPLVINDLLGVIRDHFLTDVSIQEGLRMLEIAKTIDTNEIRTAVIDNAPDGLLASQNINGAAVLVPKAGIGNFEDIQAFVKGNLFADGFLRRENAQIDILNGTNVAGLADEAAQELSGLGYSVANIDNSPQKGIATTIFYADKSKYPYTVELLQKRFGVSAQSGTMPEYVTDSDIVVVLGSDYANKVR